MKIIIILFAVISTISGCALYPQPSSNNYPQQSIDNATLISQRNELANLRSSMYVKKKRLEVERLQSEIDSQKKEIDELQARIDELEARISAAEAAAKARAPASPYTSSSGQRIGPRGGCYTITKSGKKNYGGC